MLEGRAAAVGGVRGGGWTPSARLEPGRLLGSPSRGCLPQDMSLAILPEAA